MLLLCISTVCDCVSVSSHDGRSASSAGTLEGGCQYLSGMRYPLSIHFPRPYHKSCYISVSDIQHLSGIRSPFNIIA